jgi:hypothetical protein
MGQHRLRWAIAAFVLILAAGTIAYAIQVLGSPAPRRSIASLFPSPSGTTSSSPSETPTVVTPNPSVSSTSEPCPTATPWTSTTAPAPRIGAAMTYDATLGKLMVFSGVRGDTSCQSASTWILQDNWTWDGRAWVQLRPASLPPGRSFGAMAYDDSRRMTLLFGGGAANSDPMRLDTWTWNGSTWSQLHPSVAPASEGLMTYETASRSFLWFGGSTYSWDGRTWVDLHPAHSPSSGALAFITNDAARRVVVLVTIEMSGKTNTWTWSGTDWQQQHPVHQPSGDTAAGAYDAQRGVVVALIGNQTWIWNGTDWVQQHPAQSPEARYFASAAYDPAVGKVMLFGGKIYGTVNGIYRELVNNELWGWDGTSWTRAA